MKILLASVAAVLTASAFAACGSPPQPATPDPSASSAAPPASSSAAPPASSSAAQEPVVGPPQVAWKDMTKEQRARYMGAVVTPKMKELFVGFDAKTFADFGCKTCHGDGVDDKSFKMPNPKIFVLPGTHEGFVALAKDKASWMGFMATKVKPQMAALLGLEDFDPKQPKPGAFGCIGCHTSAKKPGG